jgi:glycerol-3-phosphate acyltransferase PlsX
MTEVRIALDAMGGDHAPAEIVKGALLAIAELPVRILLVGRQEAILGELAGVVPDNIEIVDAREVVEMDDTALAPLRKKRNSSIRVCANLVAEGRADAFVSAGNTGATWTSARLVMGMIEGVSRPALATVLPSVKGHTLLLDVGANVDTKPNHLREFAVMGHFYSQMLFGIEAPRVGLLSIGEEATKGNELTREAHRLLKASPLSFIGNVEARHVYSGEADVIVCDGFTGNVALKVSEGLVEVLADFLTEDFRRRVDYSEYGGAPLLGVAGIAIVGHGRSSAKAVRNAVAMAYRFASDHFIQRLERDIAVATVPHQ